MNKREKFFTHLRGVGIELNSSQSEAVSHSGGPLVVFAGPGSGKTTVLTCRAAYLMQVEQVPPHQMLIVTFTRAAAREMRDRLANLPGVGHMQAQSYDTGTFHSIFLRILLRTFGSIPKLLEEHEQRKIMRDIIRKNGRDGNEEEVNEMLTKIGLCKNNLILPEQIKPKKKENIEFQKYFRQYELWKQENTRWDYDDILVECYQLLTSKPDVRREYENKYKHILVDEFQDTNYVQYEILKILVKNGNLFIVGDDDQSIYRFRGSRVEYLLSFQDVFPKAEKIILGTNYRSTDIIIELASKVIQGNHKRQTKQLTGTGRQGLSPIFIEPSDERTEAKLVLEHIQNEVKNGGNPDDIAVLFRTNLQGQALIDELVQTEMIFSMRDTENDYYHRWQIRDIICYLQLAINPYAIDALIQVINRPKRYIYPDSWANHFDNGIKDLNRTSVQRFLDLPDLESWKRKKLEELAWDLKKISVMTPREALRFIRNQIGYEDYLNDYISRTGQKKEYVWEPLAILEQAVVPFQTIKDFLLHVEKVKQVLKQAKMSEQGIQLMTFHRAKGLEFKTVFIIGMVKGMVPHNKSIKDKQSEELMEEERRLFYVGITRAKEKLYLSSPKKYRGDKMERSPFLNEIDATKR